MSKIYYYMTKLVNISPLLIGGGKSENSDIDIITNSEGAPYIPGTSLCGACRHFLQKQNIDTKSVFGYTENYTENGEKSNIVFYDANLETNNYTLSVRDNVKLGSNRVAIKGAKFDYEILEQGYTFLFRFSVKDNSNIAKYIFEGFKTGEIRLGAKTSRGLGVFSINEIFCHEVNISKNPFDYINFSWDQVTDSYVCQDVITPIYDTLKLKFTLPSFLFIRNYATLEVDKNNDNKMIDAEQLLNRQQKPVVPGTTWAGVFRHHFEKILDKIDYKKKDELINDLFGYVNDKNAACSKIIFPESVIEGSHCLNRTRNAVDRFTGSSGSGKLFTTRPSYLGSGFLEIKLLSDVKDKEFIKSILKCCIDDLNEGYLAVGGESATGGGLIRIKGGDMEWK